MVILTGCGGPTTEHKGLPGNQPPSVKIEIDGQEYDTILGTYCWGPNGDGYHECADTAGPVGLLADETPIQVTPNEEVTIMMDYTPLPDKIELAKTTEQEEIDNVELIDNQFNVPAEKGIYYYDYAVWWMDEDDHQVSLGDAFYAFVIEVK